MTDTNEGIKDETADGTATGHEGDVSEPAEDERQDEVRNVPQQDDGGSDGVDSDGHEDSSSDDDGDGLGEKGKLTLTKLRRENRKLARENESLQKQVDELKHDRYVDRVTRLATGRLRYPEDAVKLIDGVDADSGDDDVKKAIDALLKRNPGYGVGNADVTLLHVSNTSGRLGTPKDTRSRVNSARFAAQLAQCGV